jgi:hypothetical protein
LNFPSLLLVDLIWFFQEESAEGSGHGLDHLYNRPVPAVWLPGHLWPLLAAAMDAHKGLPAERCGGDYRRHLRTGERWVVGPCCQAWGVSQA